MVPGVVKGWKHMGQITVSITFGRLLMLHFGRGPLAISTRACYKGLAHYRKVKAPIGKSMRNMWGDLIHYDNDGNCIGYSRHTRFGRIVHYDGAGEPLGHSRWILRLVAIHRIED